MEVEQLDHAWGINNGQKTEKLYTGSHDVGWECVANMCWIKFVTPWKESCDQPRQHIKKQRHYFANKGPSSHLVIQLWFFQQLCMDVRAGL